MAYQNQYETYLQRLPGCIDHCRRTGKRPVFGYSSNLDVVISWDAAAINRIAAEYLHESPVVRDGDTIGSMADFARIVGYYARKGIGGEIDITSAEICAELRRRFKTQQSLGGTCAHGAAALARTGMPVLAHPSNRSEAICRLLDFPGLDTIGADGLIPISQSSRAQEAEPHFIFQYEKGGVLRLNGHESVIPVSNRLIMNYDFSQKTMPLDPLFLAWCEENADKLFAYNISGFNTVDDLSIVGERIDTLKQHYNTIRAKNPGCVTYLEGAHYLNPEAKRLVYRQLSGCIDLFGMNEEELVDFTERMGITVDPDNLESMVRGLQSIRKTYSMRGIVMHTKDYAMFIGQTPPGIEIEMGLTLGNLIAGTRARTGDYGSIDDCRDTLSLALSPVGLAFAQQLEKIDTGCDAVLVPSRYLENPACTVGLGDSFAAGMLTAFIR